MNFDLFEAGSFSPKPPVRNKTPSLAEQRKRAFDSFRFSLPKEVARVLEGFRSHQWHLLTMLAYDKHGLDLAQTNPVLAYAVADWFADHPSTRRELGRMKQRELLALLKLPDTEALVKLMRKIPPESIDRRLWKPLLSVLRHPDGSCSKFLAHVPVINLGVMELILTRPICAALSPPLLSEVAADPKENYRASAAALFRDILAMKAELNDNRPLNAIPSLHASVNGTMPYPPSSANWRNSVPATAPCHLLPYPGWRGGSSRCAHNPNCWLRGGSKKTASPVTRPESLPANATSTRCSTRLAPHCPSVVNRTETGAFPCWRLPATERSIKRPATLSPGGLIYIAWGYRLYRYEFHSDRETAMR
jgi:hypothetical protein